jgi:hypothetical protein
VTAIPVGSDRLILGDADVAAAHLGRGVAASGAAAASMAAAQGFDSNHSRPKLTR